MAQGESSLKMRPNPNPKGHTLLHPEGVTCAEVPRGQRREAEASGKPQVRRDGARRDELTPGRAPSQVDGLGVARELARGGGLRLRVELGPLYALPRCE